jgi:hypothetical protein
MVFPLQCPTDKTLIAIQYFLDQLNIRMSPRNSHIQMMFWIKIFLLEVWQKITMASASI